ncbi:EamA family transporter RarD [Microbacterium sp. cx-55]|uniref:EamA family transporter RarD n=1 Tax=Microbacterium sp. cx-55 TaxID=2875948 RepID=UPI001CBE7D43|nr:EamA family transporter RarD [Microbacterium sp. cx-55]MBZ4486929.1 EamA family transporter RarD [Microbacterium sp. cx-55]UGB35850.1 EamA family transporter RarD [Microbacterium sp. cx-55]
MTPNASADQTTAGGLYAFGAYFLWGFLPLYFVLLAPIGPFEIVAWRILLSLVFCALLILVTRSWGRLVAILRQPRLLGLTALAGALIYVNWQVFLYAALSGHVIETSLGYFINPIVTVLLGVLLLHERLRLTQWIAIGLAAVAVGVIVVGYGVFPWIALSLAFSFGFYGLVKKKIGPAVDAVSGLTLESAWLTPVALVQLGVVAATGGLLVVSVGMPQTALLAAAGIATATPLLMFAAAARRAPLSLLGIMQFVAPVLQFVIGAWLLGEEMTTGRWIGFAIVWVALILLTTDSLLAARRTRRGRADAAAARERDDAPSDVAELT